MNRKPAVAGSFYPLKSDDLNTVVSKYISAGKEGSEEVKAIIVPHAGYVYSGKVAGLVYSEVAVPDKIILIGPNHTGLGSAVSIMCSGTWEIPGKKVNIDSDLAEKISEYSSSAEVDIKAHMMEHSLEVQLPFAVYNNPDISFVPIIIGTHQPDVLEELGEAIAKVVMETDSKILLIASSDMSHYISEEAAEYYDKMAIEKIKFLDYKGLLEVVDRENISMCGAGPVAVVLKACELLGASKAELVHYNTSAEASGDTSQVVGYAGLKIL